MDAPPLLCDGPADAETRLILAHGAGAPMDSPAMTALAEGIAAAGIRVTRFEFPYMAARRRGSGGGRPDAPARLTSTWKQVIAAEGGGARVVICGRSMGGRIASMLADEVSARGLICMGYPFHPAGKPERTRTQHLATLATPTLIVQGTRDAMGNPEDVAGYTLSEAIRLHWLEDGDHGFKPRKKSGRTLEQNQDEAIEVAVGFMRAL